MKIVKKSIRNAARYLEGFEKERRVIIGITIDEEKTLKLSKIGFSSEALEGERTLPTIIGPKTRFNSNGKTIPIKTLPKETYYIEREWQWTDWSGKDYSKIVYISRERYQREQIQAPSVELQIVEKNGQKIVITDIVEVNEKNYDLIRDKINVLLEIFGECQIFDEGYIPVIDDSKIKKINWTILRPGKKGWDGVQEEISEIIKKAKKTKRGVYSERIEYMKSLDPDFIAQGCNGYSGYIVFAFPNKNKYILENIFYGNALYVFEEDWETLSKLTKTEVLLEELYHDRIPHYPNWKEKVKENLR